MDKYKRLVSNTLLFAISTFSSKILSFFLTAYRTRVMGTADYGGMDAIVTIGNFFHSAGVAGHRQRHHPLWSGKRA